MEAKKKTKKSAETVEDVSGSTDSEPKGSKSKKSAEEDDIAEKLKKAKERKKAKKGKETTTIESEDANAAHKDDKKEEKKEDKTEKKEEKKKDDQKDDAKEKRLKKYRIQKKRADKRKDRLANRLKVARIANRDLASQRRKRTDKMKELKDKESHKKDKMIKQKLLAQSENNRRKSEDKLKHALKEAQRTSTNIISLNDDAFKYMLNELPRPYYSFVSLTALHPSNKCHMCVNAHNEMLKMAEYYKKNHLSSFTPNYANISDYYALEEGNKGQIDAPLFFFELDVQKAQDTFTKLNLKYAPVILIVPPKALTNNSKIDNPPVPKFLDNQPAKNKFQLISQRFEANDFQTFIYKRAGIDIKTEVKIDWVDLFLYFCVLSFVCAIVYFYGVSNVLALFRKFRMLFCYFGFVAYVFCISGGMYNIIRGSWWANYNEKGRNFGLRSWQTSYVNPAFRDQYVTEGYFMGMGFIVMSLCLIMLIVHTESDYAYLFFGQRQGKQDETDKKKDKGGKDSKEGGIQQLLKTLFSPLVAICVGIIAWFLVFDVFNKKYYGGGNYF